MANSSRYRMVDWQAERILENTELNRLQGIYEGVNTSGAKVVYDLDQIYRPGAIQNITVVISGLTASFSATDATKPMAVFVRGRWEALTAADFLGGSPTLTLSGVQTQIYLNYALNIVTWNGAGGTLTDSSLVDSVTGDPTANMGELDLSIAAADTSGVALNGATQLEKNITPIVMFLFTNSGTELTLVAQDNVNPQALGTLGVAGLVKTTTATGAGVVVSTDDSRMTDTRTPTDLTVIDASVRVPLAVTGTNADGSDKYDLTLDPGGISADKIIWQEVTERVSDALAWLNTQFAGILATLASHIGVALGSPATHPFPTAGQVGAAPANHVNKPLDPGPPPFLDLTTHPAWITADQGGFGIARTGITPVAMDPGFGVTTAGVLQAGLLHSGDAYSLLAEALEAYPGGVDGDGAQTPTQLGLMSAMAAILAGHVNKVSHKNPHGTTPASLGILSSLGTNGYMLIPLGAGNNFMIQWGHLIAVPLSSPGTAVTFSPWFSNACIGAWGIASCPPGFDGGYVALGAVPTASGVSFWVGSAPSNRDIFWFAIGY